jgi:adenosylcobinamide-GDP ribazoletransferase
MNARGLSGALSTFTILPVRTTAVVTRADGRELLIWLPAVGLLIGALAGLPITAVREGASQAGLVGAVLGVAVLAVLTRGLHLDGLADTSDGLASHAPAAQALEIMRRSDIGPFGVMTIVFVLALDIAAVASLSGSEWKPVAALAVAAATGRLAVIFAAHESVRSARPTGFGALVAGSLSSAAVIVEAIFVLVAGGVLAWAVGANAGEWVLVQAVALLIALVLTWHTSRRFGGLTGDVFGALIECATAVTLVGIAFV